MRIVAAVRALVGLLWFGFAWIAEEAEGSYLDPRIVVAFLALLAIAAVIAFKWPRPSRKGPSGL